MSAFYEVMKLVEGWQPEAFPTELKYRDSLAALLRAQLEGTIETEYRHAGTTIDVYVKQAGFWKPSKVYIELKRNLLHKAQLDRLVGQLESLAPKKNSIIVLLCGETSPSLLTRLTEKYDTNSIIAIEPTTAIVTKPPGKQTASR